MKRIVASIGVAALGAACVQSSNAQGDGSKPWTVSVALRGFYDDNVNTVKNGKVDTFGVEISPTLAFGLRMDQTTASLVYTYAYKYYDHRPDTTTDHDDMTHTIAASLLHAFNERTTLSISDSFVIGQEPDVLRSGPAYPSFQRISGQNVRNFGNLTLNHQFTPKFGMEVGYANSIFDYEDDAFAVVSADKIIGIDPGPPLMFLTDPLGPYPVGVNPISRSGVLDRIEQTAHLDARWTIKPTTVGLIGYAFSLGHYTANQPIGVVNLVGTNIANNIVVNSDDRDSRSHSVYAGAEHTFLPGLHGSLRVGARFTDYFNSPAHESGTSPYVAASLHYDVSKDSSLQLGLSHDLSATDAFSTQQGGSITSDSEVTVVYASLTHRILPTLSGSLMGQFQNSTFRGGQFDSDSEQYYLLSASLTYQINRHVSTSLSYNYDLLESSVPNRGFDRNRVYLGATFTY